jgi:endonuclease/exonuclease/phosphatase (EEP) superfamily protein YafD
MDARQQPLPKRSHLTIWGLLEAASTVLCAATVTGFLGRFWWMFELTTHFPVQLAVCLGTLSVIWIAKKRWKAAVACGTFAIINGVLVVSVLVPNGNETQSSGEKFRLVAANVLTSNQNKDAALEFLRKADADVILLIETDERWLEALEPLFDTYPNRVVEPRDDNFGIALFSRPPLTNTSVIDVGTADVPSIATDVVLGSQSIHLLGTHAWPPSSSNHAFLRNNQLEQIAAFVRRQSGPVVVVGDLNATPWSPYFADLLRDSGLKNSSQGRGLFGSWHANLPVLRIPLDHCLVSPEIHVLDKRLGPNIGSDHLPVIVDLQISSHKGVASAQRP